MPRTVILLAIREDRERDVITANMTTEEGRPICYLGEIGLPVAMRLPEFFEDWKALMGQTLKAAIEASLDEIHPGHGYTVSKAVESKPHESN